MKKLSWILVFALVVGLMTPAFAAPLFPDVPEQHWARDAVADLAAKGILEGYPDGTFKGDRAATRWEMAMALQRFLAKMEAEHATFATKADLEALKALVNNLKDELDALGVRVKNLEENVASLDTRVTELERITFEGDFTTRLVTMGMKNRGRVVAGVAGFWDGDLGSINGATNYLTGTYDMFNGRPLVSGTSFTARARLGVKVKVNKDMDAGVRFAAYTSMGDQVLDAYWGISAPYLSNPFCGNGINAQAQAVNNTPWTRMTFDRFWIEHKPTNTTLIVGSIDKTNFDSFIISNVPNPNVAGRDRSQYEDMNKEQKMLVSTWKYAEQDEDAYLPFYGILVKGKTHFISDMMWEAMYSKLPSMNSDIRLGASDVTPHLAGANLSWKIKDQYAVKINFARVSENSTVTTGTDYTNTMINGYAADGSIFPYTINDIYNYQPPIGSDWTNGMWINPNGQVAPFPVMFLNNNSVALGPNGFTNAYIGTQAQTMYGLSFNYRFEPSLIRIALEGAGTHYKPTAISTYAINGYRFRGGIGWTNKKNTWDVDVDYIYTDPYYDAFQVRYPTLSNTGLVGLGTVPTQAVVTAGFVGQTGVTPAANLASYFLLPSMSYYGTAYQLHDSDMSPNNRAGVRFGTELRWNEGAGRANLRLGWMRQAKSSQPMMDINGVLGGYKPGFVEPVFNMLALNAAGTAMAEDQKGTVFHIGGGLEHKFNPSALKASLQYDYYRTRRKTAFADADLNGAMTLYNTYVARNNTVDLKNNVLKFGLAYAFNDRFTLRGGYDWTNLKGYHPYFNYNASSAVPFLTYNTAVNVVDVTQSTPWIGFDYDVAKNTQWSFDFRYYNQTDNLPQDFYGANTNKYSWSGVQLMTQFKVKF